MSTFFFIIPTSFILFPVICDYLLKSKNYTWEQLHLNIARKPRFMRVIRRISMLMATLIMFALFLDNIKGLSLAIMAFSIIFLTRDSNFEMVMMRLTDKRLLGFLFVFMVILLPIRDALPIVILGEILLGISYIYPVARSKPVTL